MNKVAGQGLNFSTMLTAESKNENVSEIAAEPISKKPSYFCQLRSDYNLEKANFPENALLVINQACLTVQKSKKIFYREYFLLGQIHESAKPLANIQSYVRKEDEVKYYHPRYDRDTRKFLGLYETVGFLVVRGDPSEVFLSYGYNTEMSKVLYSSFKHKIPSSFSGTLFNHHIKLIEMSDKLKMSQLFFFLPSITDRKENLNQYLKNVNITPVDVDKKKLDTLCGEPFDASKLDFESTKMRAVVISVLKEIASISNLNPKRNHPSLHSNV